MTTLTVNIRYDVEAMRDAGGSVTRRSHDWLTDLGPVSAVPDPTFGTGEFAQLAATFRGRTHHRSMDYYHEVGKVAGDVGLGLVKKSNLYEAVENSAVDLAHEIVAASEITAEVGLL